MSPHWTLTLLLIISAILGIGYASENKKRCNYFTNTECVKPDNCLSDDLILRNIRGCPQGKVCCDSSYVHNDRLPNALLTCGPNGKDLCMEQSMCRAMHQDQEIRYRSSKETSGCPGSLICCSLDYLQRIY